MLKNSVLCIRHALVFSAVFDLSWRASISPFSQCWYLSVVSFNIFVTLILHIVARAKTQLNNSIMLLCLVLLLVICVSVAHPSKSHITHSLTSNMQPVNIHSRSRTTRREAVVPVMSAAKKKNQKLRSQTVSSCITIHMQTPPITSLASSSAGCTTQWTIHDTIFNLNKQHKYFECIFKLSLDKLFIFSGN